MQRRRLTFYFALLMATCMLLGLNGQFAQAQSVYDLVCAAIPSLPYYERGEFRENDNCSSPWDSVSGSYTASKLNAEQFSPPGDDGQGGYIDVTEAGSFSLSWRVEVEFRAPEYQQSRFDDNSGGKCRGFSRDPSFVTESPIGPMSCIGSEGYSIPYQFGPAAAAGFSRGYAVTPCVEVEVEITIHAGQPAPWERRRDSMEKTIDFANQALEALVNAAHAHSACSQSSTPPPSNPPPSNPPPGNPPPSSNTQPTIQIKTSQGTQTLQSGESTTINMQDGSSAEVSANCEGVYYTFLLLYEISDGEQNPFRFVYLGRAPIYAALCEWLMDTQSSASAGIVTALSAHEILEIGVSNGGVRIDNEVPIGAVKVTTPTATVSSTGATDFTVKHDSSNGQSTVSSSQGNVSVSPNSGGSSKSVNSGQEVRVSNGGVGEVAPIGTSTPPGSNQPPSNNPPRTISNTSGLAQFDDDGDCAMDDPEFFSATDSWIFEEISNELFFSAVDAWISQTSICTSSASVRGLTLVAIELAQAESGSILFDVTAQGNDYISVDVYDLKGRHIFSAKNSAGQLRWNLRDMGDAPVANGVYLYRVSARDQFGNSVNSDVRKLVLMR